MLIDLISLAAHCLCATRIQSQHTLLSHTHTQHTHAQKERETCTHICTIVVIERLFKEAQLSTILVYYAESSPHHIMSSPSCDKISYQRRNTHVRCQQKNKKKDSKKNEPASSEIVRKCPRIVKRSWPRASIQIDMCVCIYYICTLSIHVYIYRIYRIMLHSLTGYTSIGSSSGVSASASEDFRGPVRPPPDELVPDVPVPAREREGERACEREVDGKNERERGRDGKTWSVQFA